MRYLEKTKRISLSTLRCDIVARMFSNKQTETHSRLQWNSFLLIKWIIGASTYSIEYDVQFLKENFLGKTLRKHSREVIIKSIKMHRRYSCSNVTTYPSILELYKIIGIKKKDQLPVHSPSDLNGKQYMKAIDKTSHVLQRTVRWSPTFLKL